MADITSYLKTYTIKDYPLLGAVDYREIRRYAGYMTKSGSILDELSENELNLCLKEVMPHLTYKVSYRRQKINWKDGVMDLGFDYGISDNLTSNLSGCTEVVLFAATIGIGIDRLITKYNRLSPVKALFLQAIGAERIEALCNLFNDEVKELVRREGFSTRPRYSPGYGDLKLDIQKDLMVILDCSRRLGINLNESLLMSPSKSVTAFIGICNADDCIAEDKKHNCCKCSKTDCAYRRA